MFVDALIGVGDRFEHLRNELPDYEVLEKARANVASAATEHLKAYKNDELWYEAVVRAMLRATGVSKRGAAGMTDFIRKRAEREASRRALEVVAVTGRNDMANSGGQRP